MSAAESAEAFLARSAEVLDDAPADSAECAWCSHPLTDASPSGDFCGERCAADWRAGLDWFPEERCACRTCDPEGAHHRGFGRAERRVWFVGPMDEAPGFRVDTSAARRAMAELRDRLEAYGLENYRAPARRYYLNRVVVGELRDLSADLPPAPLDPDLP